MQGGHGLNQILHEHVELSNRPYDLRIPAVLDNQRQVGGDWFKHDDFGVMVDELIIGLYRKVLHHPVEVRRLDTRNRLVSVDLIQRIQELLALKISELPHH